MLYALFLGIAIAYNVWKFFKEREAFVASLVEANNESHRLMILGHHFYIFIFEVFLALVVSHLMIEGSLEVGLLGLGFAYLVILVLGFYLYHFFIKHVERLTGQDLCAPFRAHIIKELRVSIAVILLPILIYSLIHWSLQGNIYQEWGSLWFVGMLMNILFVSVLTIVCTVVIMLKLIPNREVTEPEYLEIINTRLKQVHLEEFRVRWIETDIKNAFVVGIQLFQFSNQTMFIGKRLRTMLTLEEFDAVIAHELAHAANRHIQRRMMLLLKNFVSILTGSVVIMLTVTGLCFLWWGEDISVHQHTTLTLSVLATLSWVLLNYVLLFDNLRAQEYEADAYAVIELGAGLRAIQTALEKLTGQDEVPKYLKDKTQRPKSRFHSWLSSYFSTHPSLEARVASLEKKLRWDLPFDHYISPVQKAHTYLSQCFRWQFLVPSSALAAVALVWIIVSIREGGQLVAFVRKAPAAEIIANERILARINSRPALTGPSLMYYVVQRGEPELIDHYLSQGAEKGRTLVYIAQLQDIKLLKRYYSLHQKDLSENDYFLILRKTAALNFTAGYRFLINSDRFETLQPSYKQDLARLHEKSTDRAPASVEE
jgi:Zn-dependent protease with chaperone function